MDRRHLAAALLAIALPAAAQVNTCVYPDGSIVYTDRGCASLGAERAADGIRARLVPRYRNACARDLPTLLVELSTAIEVGDVNQLAAYYRWTGMSTRAGYQVMDRLEQITDRPLVDIVPLYPDPDPLAGSLYVPPVDARSPVGLRIEQTLEDGTTPTTSTLRLERELGCWWVRW